MVPVRSLRLAVAGGAGLPSAEGNIGAARPSCPELGDHAMPNSDEGRAGERELRVGAWVRVKRGLKGDRRASVVKLLNGHIMVLIDGKMTRIERKDAELV
jgi:hypothetical protein